MRRRSEQRTLSALREPELPRGVGRWPAGGRAAGALWTVLAVSALVLIVLLVWVA